MIPLAASAAISLAPSVMKWFSGRSQRRRADAINPVNPGFVQNQGIIDNARMLGDRYGNYNLPGMGAIQDDIRSSYAGAFSRGVQGASSSGDVLALASSLSGQEANAMTGLGVQNAQGKEAALNQYLHANQLAGNEPVRQNMYELEQYQQQLREKAALEQTGAQNQYGALNEAAGALSTGINAIWGQPMVENAGGNIGSGASAWDRWMAKRNKPASTNGGFSTY